MKKIILAACLLTASSLSLFAQSIQKPKIMVMPDREWCIRNAYTDDNNPNEPDFYKALMDKEFPTCITTFSGLMAERGYPLKDLSSTLESFKTGKAKRMVMTGKDKSTIRENDEDMLARAAALDIKIRFDIKTVSAMGRNKVEFLVKAIDAATDEIIWGEPLPAQITAQQPNTVLVAAISGKMESFCNRLQAYFDGLATNGRKCYVEFNMSESCPLEMSSDITVGDEEAEFSDFIIAWMTKNAAPGGVAPVAKEDNLLSAEVFIPLFGESLGTTVSLNAEQWVKKLNKELKPYGVQMKTSMMGQGKVYCMISGL